MVAAFQVLVSCLDENEAVQPGQFPAALAVYMEMIKSNMPAIFILAVSVLLFAQPALAQKISTTASTGDYASDLGTLNGVVKMAGFTRDICIEAHPDMQQTISEAYNVWREQYKPFLQEIAMRLNLLLIEEARQLDISLAQEMVAFTTEVAKMKPGLWVTY